MRMTMIQNALRRRNGFKPHLKDGDDEDVVVNQDGSLPQKFMQSTKARWKKLRQSRNTHVNESEEIDNRTVWTCIDWVNDYNEKNDEDDKERERSARSLWAASSISSTLKVLKKKLPKKANTDAKTENDFQQQSDMAEEEEEEEEEHDSANHIFAAARASAKMAEWKELRKAKMDGRNEQSLADEAIAEDGDKRHSRLKAQTLLAPAWVSSKIVQLKKQIGNAKISRGRRQPETSELSVDDLQEAEHEEHVNHRDKVVPESNDSRLSVGRMEQRIFSMRLPTSRKATATATTEQLSNQDNTSKVAGIIQIFESSLATTMEVSRKLGRKLCSARKKRQAQADLWNERKWDDYTGNTESFSGEYPGFPLDPFGEYANLSTLPVDDPCAWVPKGNETFNSVSLNKEKFDENQVVFVEAEKKRDYMMFEEDEEAIYTAIEVLQNADSFREVVSSMDEADREKLVHLEEQMSTLKTHLLETEKQLSLLNDLTQENMMQSFFLTNTTAVERERLANLQTMIHDLEGPVAKERAGFIPLDEASTFVSVQSEYDEHSVSSSAYYQDAAPECQLGTLLGQKIDRAGSLLLDWIVPMAEKSTVLDPCLPNENNPSIEKLII